jgi:hypothetical protein
MAIQPSGQQRRMSMFALIVPIDGSNIGGANPSHPWVPPQPGTPTHPIANPPVTASPPIALPPGQPYPPSVNPPIVPPNPPPGSIWPPLPPDGLPAGKAVILVFISGYGARYIVVDVPQPK